VTDGKIDLYSDEYIMEIVSSHDLWPGNTYNDKMTPTSVKIYTILMYLAFYGSNFLFRPQRFFKMMRNLITNQHESRAESVLAQTFTKLRLSNRDSLANKRQNTPLLSNTSSQLKVGNEV
jgi:hypothetical protein